MSASVRYEAHVMNLEGLFLQKTTHKLLEDKSECKGVDLHKCTRSCHLRSLDPRQPFSYHGDTYAATGFVFVCQRTTKIHMCGADYCEYATLMEDGVVCTLTGLFLAQELSLARTRFDPDVRVAGREVYNASMARMPVDAILPSALETQSLTERLYKLAGNNTSDVHHIIARHRGDLLRDFEDVKKKVVMRYEWRTHAMHAYARQVLNEDYVQILETTSEKATSKWYAQQEARAMKCKERGVSFTCKSMMDAWADNVEDEYKSVYIGDVCEQNTTYRDYYIECMLNIWEKFQSMPEVAERNISFSDCCTAILRSLELGFEAVVYVVDGIDRPFQNFAQMTNSQQAAAKKVTVHIIDAHKGSIFLVPPEIARGVQHAQNKKKRSRTDAPTTKGNFITGKTLSTRRVRLTHNKLRSTSQMTSIIPQFMKWHIIVNTVVENVKTLDELNEYRLCKLNTQ